MSHIDTTCGPLTSKNTPARRPNKTHIEFDKNSPLWAESGESRKDNPSKSDSHNGFGSGKQRHIALQKEEGRILTCTPDIRNAVLHGTGLQRRRMRESNKIATTPDKTGGVKPIADVGNAGVRYLPFVESVLQIKTNLKPTICLNILVG